MFYFVIHVIFNYYLFIFKKKALKMMKLSDEIKTENCLFINRYVCIKLPTSLIVSL